MSQFFTLARLRNLWIFLSGTIFKANTNDILSTGINTAIFWSLNDFYRKINFFWPFLFLMSEFFHPFPLIWDYMKKIKIGYSHQKLYFWKVEILSFHMVYHTYIFIDFQNWPKIGSQCSQLSLEPVFCHILK